MRYYKINNTYYCLKDNETKPVGSTEITKQEFDVYHNITITSEQKDYFLQTESYKDELAGIKHWFETNDWKVNKIVTGEWTTSDSRWTEYLSERAAKRARQDELNDLLSK